MTRHLTTATRESCQVQVILRPWHDYHRFAPESPRRRRADPRGRPGSRRARRWTRSRPVSSRRVICGTDSVRNVSEKRCTRRSPSAALDVLLIEDRQPPRAILPHRFDQRERACRGRAAREADAIRYSSHFGRSGTRSMPNSPPRRSTRATDASVRVQIALARQRLQDAVRRHHERRTAPRAERQLADVAADERARGRPAARARAACAPARASLPIDRCRRSARRRARPAPRCGRCRSRARAPAVLRGREPLPERDVAPRDASARSPSRRTARSRPSRASLRSCPWRI